MEEHRTISSIEKVCKELGFNPIPSPLLGRHMGHGCWLPAADRIADISRALQHDIVWAGRGGHGCIHLVETVLAAKPRKTPFLIGYSDLTVLHACWRVRAWEESFYGSIPADADISRGFTSLCALMQGEGLQLSPENDAGVRVIRPGSANGTCFAACVSVLAGLCGTAAQPDLRGCILAIEDIAERPYQIDFCMNQLHLAGVLDGVVGLVGGGFTHDEKPDYLGPSVEEILLQWGQRLRVPVLGRLPFGHVTDGLFIPCGREIAFSADIDGSWSLAILPRREPLPWVA
jgi:muramoyltetrapeptide carboxypeptidase